MGPQYVRRELMGILPQAFLTEQGSVAQQKETGAVRTEAELGGWGLGEALPT